MDLKNSNYENHSESGMFFEHDDVQNYKIPRRFSTVIPADGTFETFCFVFFFFVVNKRIIKNEISSVDNKRNIENSSKCV